ncbi:MAG: carboxymuconolactone decarboxylase family protein [Kofleriaceae bacterium]|nr:carboxymuconolactone decarboxylase family protein [Kofleriaceae bacterium]MCB9570776.1 carboxymuconolactone decarboxylase family protein [Kofleriaceae bacterium]
MAPRIAPGTWRDLGPINWMIARALARAAGTRDGNLFTTLGRHRRLFRGWLAFAAHLMPGGVLARRDTELVILRVAHLRGCAYELDHHRRLAARAGVAPAIAARVAAGPDAAGWTARERALLAATDALVARRDLDDATWAALRRCWDEPAIIELCLLVGHYDLLATTIAALRIARDRPR